MKNHPWKQSDVDPLIALGVTKNQAMIYLASLHYGLMAATDVSRVTGINRQQVYSDTEKLIEYGLLDITKKQRKKFIAADPSALVTLAEKRKAEVQNAAVGIAQSLPFLESLRSSSSHRVTIKYFEGMKRIRDAYTQELACCHDTEVLSFVGSVDDLFQFFPESYWSKWNEQFVKQKNQSKMLVHSSRQARDTAKHDEKYQRETRYIDPFPMKVNIDIFGNTTLIVSVYDELAMWIESSVVADSYRILFRTCWNHAKPF